MDKIGLGKGLSAILGEIDPVQEAGEKADVVELVPVQSLQPGRYQPRKVFAPEQLADLVASIAAKGVLQPLLVRPIADNKYEIIAGERRWRAASQAGLKQVPAIVRHFSDKETLEVSLIENLQRQDLNALEEAAAYARLMKEFQYTQEELSKVVGKSRSHVANMMRLLDLPDSVKKLLESNELSAGHARALLNTAHPETLAKKIIAQGLNVRQAEQLAMQTKKPRATGAAPAHEHKDRDILALEAELSALLKTAVSIKWTGKSGKITVACNNLEKLDTILQRLTTGGPVED
ncbi:MAG: ParB/RepB/Spo0J family partition protein [Alphaproteobacteria bacterium]|nr:ParB/RepB/Spo0J family partition protein [Alphaproteobacteria bacterium]